MKNNKTRKSKNEPSMEEMFNHFMENSPIYVFFKDDKIRSIKLSRNYEKMLGKPLEELLGKTMDELFPSDLAKSMVADDLRVLKEGKQITIEEELNGRFYTTTKFPIIHNGKPLYLAGYTIDITEHKLANEELKSRNTLLNALINSASDIIIFSLDKNYCYTAFNEKHSREMKHVWNTDIKIGMNLLECMRIPELRTLAKQSMDRALKGETFSEIQHQFDLNIYYEFIWSPIHQNEEIVGITAFVRDITEHKKLEETLLRINKAVESSRDAIGISAAPHAHYFYHNKALIEMLEYTAEELQAVGGGPAVYANKDVALEVFNTVRNGGSWSGEVEMVSKSGRRFIVLLRADAIKDENGVQIGIIGVHTDITERKKAEEKLKESEERYRALMEQASDGIFLANNDGQYIDVNTAGCKLTGYTREEILKLTLRDLAKITPDNPLHMEELREGKALLHEREIIRKDGTLVPVEISAKMLADGCLYGILRDISGRKQAEAERLRLEQQIQQDQKLESLGILAGGIAHDFNNLMGGIFGNIDLARSVSKEVKTIQYLEATLNTMNRARALTQQLLTFSKGGAPIQKITPLISFIQETVQFALSGSDISCRFDLAENLWLCNIDRNQIGQVIDNIIINAEQAMPNGGTIEVAAKNISVGEKELLNLTKGNYVKVSIKDFGIGIPKDIMPRIFEPFYTTKTKGHGLGLATCYSIINRHGGAIEVESEQGKGSTFHFYLPASTKSVVANTDTVIKRVGSGTIIVMDDEEVLRVTTRHMLKAMGYSVVCKNDGKEVLDFFIKETEANRTFAAIILDLTIPGGMGGKTVIAEIRKLDKEIPVFVVSGYTDDPIMKNPIEYGFTASICKPFTMAELSEMLNKNMKN